MPPRVQGRTHAVLLSPAHLTIRRINGPIVIVVCNVSDAEKHFNMHRAGCGSRPSGVLRFPFATGQTSKRQII